ncbi:MAG: polyphosphate kinase 2 family protein [Hellea sp.]|nr:polyphosphate kinase 2 family protein [Hellea sp.]
MNTAEEYIKAYRIDVPQEFSLPDMPTRANIFPDSDEARHLTKQNARAIGDLAHKLYAERKRSLLIVLQGMDTSGKDGTTAACFNRTAPLNIKVAPFKAPSKKELSQDYLWRVHQVVPAKGDITVFNRSHYEDVLIVKVRRFAPPDKVEQRYDQINNFEKHLTENGTTILKFMLNISYDKQGERLKERLIEPQKFWKFNPADLEDRKLWPEFMDAYETMVRRTSTPWAPWHIIPCDSRSRRGAIISSIARKTLEDMGPEYPESEYNLSDFEI